jgi:shikimate kinase
MATGKSTFGRLVATRLGMRFIDVDDEIERAEGVPISELFQSKGEPYFREQERLFIESGHPSKGCVVACGGGLVCQPGMLEAVRARGVVICLHASEEAILARTAHRKDRPLLNTQDQEARIRSLLAHRMPIYQRAGTMILTDCRSFTEVGEHILRVYKPEAREFNRPAINLS